MQKRLWKFFSLRLFPLRLFISTLVGLALFTSPVLSYAEPVCGESIPTQINYISSYEKEKNSFLQQHKPPALFLRLAEKSFQRFSQTDCENYLFESGSLYKSYYKLSEKPGYPKKSMNESTKREYRIWSERIQEGLQKQAVLPFLLPEDKVAFFSELERFRYQLDQERIRVDKFLQERNRILIPSVLAMAGGISLIIAESYILSTDGHLTNDYCSLGNGLEQRCAIGVNKALVGTMLGLGVGLTIGGATGLGVSLYQANQHKSPLALESSSR